MRDWGVCRWEPEVTDILFAPPLAAGNRKLMSPCRSVAGNPYSPAAGVTPWQCPAEAPAPSHTGDCSLLYLLVVCTFC